MQIVIDREILLKSLGYIQAIVEKKGTLPILSNVLIEIIDSKLRFTSTDLDLIYTDEISNLEIKKEGSTTTSANIFYDIVRKLPSNSKVELSLQAENKLQLKSGNSNFNLLCLSPNDFPLSEENFQSTSFDLDSKKILKLLNKTKFSISNDETRHYLNGIFLHKTKIRENIFLTAAATDSHRMSVCSLKLSSDINFEPIILPRKTIYQLISLLEDYNDVVKISNNKSKIKFQLKNRVLISKVIDGKFPDYNQVIPKDNKKILEINLKDFINSVDRVASVSSDRKEGVKMDLSSDSIKLSVKNLSSGDGMEIIKSKFNSETISISFNSKYLTDVASQIDGDKIKFYLNNAFSPALITDPVDSDSLYVVMPMKV